MASDWGLAIDWFNSNFQDVIKPKISGTPFPDYFFPALALKETGYLWSRLARRTNISVSRVLELCVGDIIDAPKRGAFPTSRKVLEDEGIDGARMFQIAKNSLTDLNSELPDYRKYTTEDKFCRGFGIFQYDLQHYRNNSSFFLNRKWIDFDNCLDVCLMELGAALKRAYGNKPKTALSDAELVYVAIAYNQGSVNTSKGFDQGHKGTYGTEFHDFLIASKLRNATSNFALPILKRGSRGTYVERWQQFLIGQGFDTKGVDGTFGKDTKTATIEFQKKFNLKVDGEVGDETYGQAAKLGLSISSAVKAVNVSTPKATIRLASLLHNERIALFGSFEFEHQPRPNNYEHIKILGDWESKNIISVNVPQLAGIKGLNSKGTLQINKKIKSQILGLFLAWELAGKIGKILTCEGGFNSRFKRGKAIPANLHSSAALSNHAWGTAFDINAPWNPYYHQPAPMGEYGSVRELVAIANEFGLFWGGDFKNGIDGMHFEASTIKPQAEVDALIQKYREI